jgi:hypothetical protein
MLAQLNHACFRLFEKYIPSVMVALPAALIHVTPHHFNNRFIVKREYHQTRSGPTTPNFVCEGTLCRIFPMDAVPSAIGQVFAATLR